MYTRTFINQLESLIETFNIHFYLEVNITYSIYKSVITALSQKHDLKGLNISYIPNVLSDYKNKRPKDVSMLAVISNQSQDKEVKLYSFKGEQIPTYSNNIYKRRKAYDWELDKIINIPVYKMKSIIEKTNFNMEKTIIVFNLLAHSPAYYVQTLNWLRQIRPRCLFIKGRVEDILEDKLINTYYSNRIYQNNNVIFYNK